MEVDDTLAPVALFSLAAQHISVTWTQRTAEFASYLFIIDLFPTTLLPAALYGFVTTLAGILFGGNAGSLVDHPSRLNVIRFNIFLAKLSVVCLYAFLLVLFVKFPAESKEAGQRIGRGGHGIVWTLFSLTAVAGSVMKLADISMSVAIERDWVTTIAANSNARLTRLNLWIRRIDLGCKLLSPLFTGLLTSTVGNTTTLIIIAAIALGGLSFELLWINVVWKHFPVLSDNQNREAHSLHPVDAGTSHLDSQVVPPSSKLSFSSIKTWAMVSYEDWKLFIHSPVFLSSLSISLLYFTTLSFDGTMVAWLKTNTYSDGLISGMRGIAVCTGLLGTAIMPVLEKKVGLTRAGSWSIWSENFSLLPVVISFYIGTKQGAKAPAWNQALLFGGMAISRIGLWSFDLCQLKLLQLTLADHPRRNTLNGLQFSLQNLLDLLRYIMVIFLSRPSEFKYTAVISFGAVFSAASSYLVYLRRERGHLIHAEWFTRMRRKFQ
ncbi:Solute carrier family 40 member 1 [Psilocybe cubensis]|uniref:Solute carrier family 40 member 1 n=2 Tax=Psilocybe cubensis TaxID=181762 RepID=A0ACB8HGK0_PSICU|nr:Solute carrier family 40 member 1 [Psilocybe cubensis]KAH9487158.1 Solute carrier family 40 member 1 [Psilocybe cubensis]